MSNETKELTLGQWFFVIAALAILFIAALWNASSYDTARPVRRSQPHIIPDCCR